MRFVEHYQIPSRRIQQPLDTRWALQRVDAGDQSVVFGKGIGLAVRDVALRAEHFEIKVEHFVQFAMPVIHEAGRHDHQGAVQFAPAGKLAQDQRGLNRFAQTYLIGDQIAPGRCRGDAVGQAKRPFYRTCQ